MIREKSTTFPERPDINEGAVGLTGLQEHPSLLSPYKKRACGRKCTGFGCTTLRPHLGFMGNWDFSNLLYFARQYISSKTWAYHNMPTSACWIIINIWNLCQTFYQYVHEFRAEKDAYLLIPEYISGNARVALKIHKRFKSVSNDSIYLIQNAFLCQKLECHDHAYQDLFEKKSVLM